jgi:hypothetical protein
MLRKFKLLDQIFRQIDIEMFAGVLTQPRVAMAPN